MKDFTVFALWVHWWPWLLLLPVRCKTNGSLQSADNQPSLPCLACCACCAFMATYKLNCTSCAAKGHCHSRAAAGHRWKRSESAENNHIPRFGFPSQPGGCNPLLTYLLASKRALCYGIWLQKLNIRAPSVSWSHKHGFQEQRLFLKTTQLLVWIFF